MNNSRRLTSSACQLGLFVLVLATMIMGCSRHPKATTRDSMDFIKQVYTACNTKNPKRLSACEERLAELKSSGKISEGEIQSFQRVLKLASQGEWESAQAIALQYAQDQVR